MIKETLITVAFFATLAEKHQQPDLPHQYYPPIVEPINGVRAYGNMQVGQDVNKITRANFAATIATELS